MPAVYVHLSGRDVDDAILKANGFTKPESSPVVIPRESTVCQVDNSVGPFRTSYNPKEEEIIQV